jgi:hypothetical protein
MQPIAIEYITVDRRPPGTEHCPVISRKLFPNIRVLSSDFDEWITGLRTLRYNDK